MSPKGSPSRARLARVLAVVIGGGVGLGLGSLVLLTTPVGNDLVRAQLVRAFASAFPDARLEVTGLRTRLHDGLTLTGVELRDAQGGLLFAADELHLAWDLRGALRRRLVLKRVRLLAPRLHLAPGPGGRLALLEALGVAAGPDGPPTAWQGVDGEIQVRSLEIQDGAITWTGGGLHELDLRATGRVAGSAVEVRGVDLAGRLEGPLPARVGLQGGLSLREGDLSLADLRLDLGGSRASLAGRVQQIETAPVLDLALDLHRLQPQDVEDLLRGATPATDLSARGELTGPLRHLQARLELDAGTGGRLLAGGVLDLGVPDPTVPDPTVLDPTVPGQTRPAWQVDLSATPLDLRALYPHLLARPVQADEVQLTVTGSGLGGTAGLAAFLDLRIDGALLWDEPVSALDATATLSQQGLWLHHASLTHAAGRVQAAGAVDLARAQATLELDAGLSRLAALSALAGRPLAGAARWQPRLEADWSQALSLQAEGPLQVVGLDVEGVALAGASGPTRLSWADGALDLGGQLSARAVRTSGALLTRAQADWGLRWTAGEGTRLLAQVEGYEVSLEGSAARVEGLVAQVDVALPPGDAPLRVEVDGQVQGASPGDLSADLVGGGPIHLLLVGDHLEAGLALARPDGGSLVSGTIQGDLGLTSAWTVRDLVLEPLPGLRWQANEPATARLGPDGLLALDAALDGPAGRLHASLGEDRHLRVQGEALVLSELGRLQALLPAPPETPGAPLALQGSGSLDLDGTLDAAGRLQALQGQVQVQGLAVADQLQAVDVDLRVDGPLRQLDLGLDLRQAGDGPLLFTSRGSLPLDLEAGGLLCGAPVDLRLILLPVSQQELSVHLPTLPPTSTRLSADLRASGDACDPELSLVAAADTPAGPEGRLLRADVELSRQDAQLQLRGVVEEGFRPRLLVVGGAATGLGQVLARLLDGQPLAQAADAGIESWVDQLALSVVPMDLGLQDVRSFLDLPPAMSGRLAGGFQLTGSPRAPSVSGALQLIDGRLGGARVESALLLVMPGAGGYDLSLDSTLRPAVDGAREQATQADAGAPASFQVKGFVPVDLAMTDTASMMATEGLDLTAQGDLPLAMLEGLLEEVQDTTGALHLTARATGSLAAPVIQGDLSTQGAALAWAPLGLLYEDIEIAARVADGSVLLDRLSLSNRKRQGVLGGGRPHLLTATGRARLDQGRLAEVEAGSVELDNFWLVATRDQEVAMSGALALQGPWPGLRMEGDLRLDAAQIYFGEESFGGDRRLELDHSLTVNRSRMETIERVLRDEGPAVWQQVEVDVDLDLQRNLRLHATVPTQEEYGEQLAQLSSVSLDADLGGQLRVLQRDGKLALQGEIEPSRGSATVFGVPFDVTGGTISFVGDGYDNPLIDIQAVRVAGSYGEVDVHVTGTVQDMQIDLSSEEYPDKKDVVTLLLFGKPASEMADSEGQAGAQLVAASLSALSGQLERAVGTSVFDELEIDPAGAIRVGWALSDRAFLRVESRSGGSEVEDNRFEVTLEYLISRRLYAELMTGDRAASSARIFWRWRF